MKRTSVARTSVARKDRITDYQRIVRAQRFSPSPIRKSAVSRSSSKQNKTNSQSFSQAIQKDTSPNYRTSAENDKENNAVVASECRTIDATPEPLSQIHGHSASPKFEVDNMGLYKLPILKNQSVNKISDTSRNYPILELR